jgi:diguanylate cyclase (GGDEF)-like protein
LTLLPFTAVAYFVPLALRHSPAWAPASAIYALPIFVLAGETTAWVADQLRGANAALAEQASHDPLTGLVNRSELAEQAAAALGRTARDGSCIALLYVDLDRFKEVNDVHGHASGDAALCVVAQRLRHAVRAHDTVARLGGDEFAVLATGIADEREAGNLAARVVEAVRCPIDIGGRMVELPVSVGVTCTRDGGQSLEALLRHGDAAMYRAKRAGGNCLHHFERDAA